MNDAFERYSAKMRVYERLCRFRFHLYETGLIHSCGPRLSMMEVESFWKGEEFWAKTIDDGGGELLEG
jgi:hypothetical protein